MIKPLPTIQTTADMNYLLIVFKSVLRFIDLVFTLLYKTSSEASVVFYKYKSPFQFRSLCLLKFVNVFERSRGYIYLIKNTVETLIVKLCFI